MVCGKEKRNLEKDIYICISNRVTASFSAYVYTIEVSLKLFGDYTCLNLFNENYIQKRLMCSFKKTC